MSALSQRQIVLAERPDGVPQARHFAMVEVPVVSPGPGQLLVRNLFLSVEPAMRGWVSAVANYSDPVPLGGAMRSLAVGPLRLRNAAATSPCASSTKVS